MFGLTVVVGPIVVAGGSVIVVDVGNCVVVPGPGTGIGVVVSGSPASAVHARWLANSAGSMAKSVSLIVERILICAALPLRVSAITCDAFSTLAFWCSSRLGSPLCR